MPQMSPMSWTCMFNTMMLLLFLIIPLMIHFTFTYSKKIKSGVKTKKFIISW